MRITPDTKNIELKATPEDMKRADILKKIMKTKTNNLEEEIDEVFQKELYNFWETEEELKESGVCCVLDTIEKFILKREKALLNKPMGVSAWKKIGKKYGYWDYFLKQELKKQREGIVEIIEEVFAKKDFP